MSTEGHTSIEELEAWLPSLALTNQLHWCIVLLKEPKYTTNRLYLIRENNHHRET